MNQTEGVTTQAITVVGESDIRLISTSLSLITGFITPQTVELIVLTAAIHLPKVNQLLVRKALAELVLASGSADSRFDRIRELAIVFAKKIESLEEHNV